MRHVVTIFAGVVSLLGLLIVAFWIGANFYRRPFPIYSAAQNPQFVVDRESFGLEYRSVYWVTAAPLAAPPAMSLPFTNHFWWGLPYPKKNYGFGFGRVEMILLTRYEVLFSESEYEALRYAYVSNVLAIPLALALPLLFLRRYVVRRRALVNAGLCPVCRYDLRAHAAGEKCPECGTLVR